MNNTWCANIKSSISNDSRWLATIPFSSSIAVELNTIIFKKSNFENDNDSSTSILPSLELKDVGDTSAINNTTPVDIHEISTQSKFHYDRNNFVDLVQLLGNNSFQLSTFINNIVSVHTYPTSAVFKFEQYNSFDAKDALINDIISSARTYGTVLVCNKTNKPSNGSKTPYYNVRLTCTHFGDPRVTKHSSKKKFATNRTQAKNTIQQVPHSASSIKNRNRNSLFKRVSFDTSTDESDTSSFDHSISTKINRSSSKKCNCNFSITIMFDEKSQFWYLRGLKNTYDDNHKYHFNHM